MAKPLKVKFLSLAPASNWDRYFADPSNPTRTGCHFTFDPDATDYDWVVVYEEVPATAGAGREQLRCGTANTLLITSEPPTIKRYPQAYTSQFGHVLTTHPDRLLPHANRIYSQPALKWFYGANPQASPTHQQICDERPEKSRLISTVCSSKRQGHTLHRKRSDFVRKLDQMLPELDVFGRGIRPIDDKAEALRAYRYHIAIENYVGPHHWTEKVSDTFLGHSLPFYHGCPNLDEYFPAESYVAIDINDFDGTLEVLEQAIKDDWYQKRQSAIAEARRRVVEEFDLFTVIANIASERHQTDAPVSGKLRTRKALRLRHPFSMIPFAIQSELRVLLGRVG